MIKVVFMDLDDTLLSFSGYVKEAMREGFAHFGLKEYEPWMYGIFEEINDGLWARIEQGTLTREGLWKIRWNMVFSRLGIAFDGEVFEKYFRERLKNSAIPEPGAREILDYLAGRYSVCIVSNGPYEQQMNRLRAGKMDGYFSHCFISSQVGAQKPDPAFFDYCFAALRSAGFPDLAPEETIIVGDSVRADIAGGRRYGMRTCLYRAPDNKTGEDGGADAVISHLSELKKIL